jgi:transcriptional regulator with XRE-family HTH domain
MENVEEAKIRFGRHLIGLRNKHRMTQRSVALAAGVSPRTYQNWEAGDNLPREEQFRELCKVFSVSAAEFFPEDQAKSGTRAEIHSYLDMVLDERAAEWEWGWIFGELRKHFPLHSSIVHLREDSSPATPPAPPAQEPPSSNPGSTATRLLRKGAASIKHHNP